MRIRISKSKVIVKDKDIEFNLKEETDGDKLLQVFELAGEGKIGQLSCPVTAKAAVEKLKEIASLRCTHLVRAALENKPYDLYEKLILDQQIIDTFSKEEES